MESTVIQDLVGHSIFFTADDRKTEYNPGSVKDPLFIKGEPELTEVKVEPAEDMLDIEEHPVMDNLQESNAIKLERTSAPGTPTHSITTLKVKVKSKTSVDIDSLYFPQDDPDAAIIVKYKLKPCFVYLSRSLVSNRVFHDLTRESTKTQLQFDFQREVYVKRELKVNQCTVCYKVLCSKGYLKTHLLIHSGKRNRKCVECGKCFKTGRTLKQHQQTHKPGRFVCAHCKKTFTCRRNLAQHIKHLHMCETDRIRYSCSICSKSYSFNYDLTRHLKTHNLRHCEICNLECSDLPALRTHMKVAHKGETKHKCKTCKKHFITPEDLTIHKKLHTNTFKCSVCSRRFLTNDRLKLHKKNQHFAQYVCVLCSKSFTSKRYLSKHKLSHTKPNQCDICYKGYRCNYELQCHMSKLHSTAN